MMDDHLQASEAEVVGAVVRWGEVVVARRGEGEVGFSIKIQSDGFALHLCYFHDPCRCSTSLCLTLGKEEGGEGKEFVTEK